MSSRKTTNDEFYFDDCPICQANKRASKEGRTLGPIELLEAVEEAERQGLYVREINGLPVIITASGRNGRA